MVNNNRSFDSTLLEKVSSEVAPEVSPLMRMLLDNARRITILLVLCIVGAAGYGVYNWYSSKQTAEAQSELARILVLADGADKIMKLKAFRATAPSGVKPAVSLATARAAMQLQDYTTADEAWTDLAKDAKTPIYTTAMIGRAESLSAQEKNTESLALLEGMDLSLDSAEGVLVTSMIVDLAEKNGNLDKAVAACEKLVAATMLNPEEADSWRQKAASLRSRSEATNS